MPTATCINLRERFGERYRVTLEPPAKTWHDPWYHLIVCQHGHIYPHGGDLLGFASARRGPVANRVAALPYAQVTQDADDGMNITFPVEHFDEVAAIVKPRLRRRLSEQQRAACTERLRQYQLTPGRASEIAARQSDGAGQGRDLTTLDDPTDQEPLASVLDAQE